MDLMQATSLTYCHPTSALLCKSKNCKFTNLISCVVSGKKWILLFDKSALIKVDNLHIYGRSLVIILFPERNTALRLLQVVRY